MKVTFLPINKTAIAKYGDSLLDIARALEIDLNSVCSGTGTCKKCRVIVSKGNDRKLTDIESKIFSQGEENDGLRLACQFAITSDTCVIIPAENRKILNQESKVRVQQDSMQEGSRNLGVAIDLGTTSVAASLWDLDKKIRLSMVTSDNKQRIYGADVISRITFSLQNKANLLKLQSMILQSCNDLVAELLVQTKQKVNEIQQFVTVGNTTMSHIFFGETLEKLAKAPIEPSFTAGETRNASRLGLKGNSVAKVLLLPNIGGHVGSDTLACILTTKMYASGETNLMIDVGTNGEIVLARNQRMLACSTAAGPAFEGAVISQGMRATAGAISEVIIGNNELPRLKVIGNVKPVGICGSGIIDAIAQMKLQGVIDDTGRIVKGNTNESEKNNSFFILSQSEDNTQVRITQKDIREVQLAKAAIQAGIVILLEHMGVSYQEIDHVYLAGAFGSHLNIQNAIQIGLLPDIDPRKIKYIGNAALSGAELVLNQKMSEEAAKEICKKVEYLELACLEGFKEEYIRSINF